MPTDVAKGITHGVAVKFQKTSTNGNPWPRPHLRNAIAVRQKGSVVMCSGLPQNGQSGGSGARALGLSVIKASRERNSITPGARQVTRTWLPGLNPARSSHRPVRRIFGRIRPFQKSPPASIFNCRTDVSDLAGCKESLSGITHHSLNGETSIKDITSLVRASKVGPPLRKETNQPPCNQSVTTHKP